MDAASFIGEENWAGGFYELAIEFDSGNDAAPAAGLRTLQQALDGIAFYRRRDCEPDEPVPCTMESAAEFGHLHSVVRLPRGESCVCGMLVSRYGDESWIVFYLPLGALERTDKRIGGFPFNEAGASSLTWRKPIDDWLASIGRRVYDVAPFRRALIGFETYGEQSEDAVDDVPDQRFCGYLLPHGDGVRYWPATD